MRVPFGLFLLTIVAALLRLPGVFWELPDAQAHLQSFHPDEANVVETALRIASGDLNPHNFSYGSLLYYVDAACLWLGIRFGVLGELGDAYLVTRGVSCVLGSLTPLLVYRLTREVEAKRGPAFLAAALLAVAPGHCLLSGYATFDVGALFFSLVSLLFSVMAIRDEKLRTLAIAAIASGCAAGVKYQAAAVTLPIAYVWLRTQRTLARLAFLGLLSFGTFALTTPYALLDFDSFYREFTGLLRSSHIGLDLIFEGKGDGWSYQWTTNLPYLIGIPATALACVGLVRWLARRRPGEVVLLVYWIPCFLYLGLAKYLFYRYSLALVPCLAIAAAGCIAALTPKLRTIAAASVLVTTLGLTMAQQLCLLQEDPRSSCVAWLVAEAPQGARVATVDHPGSFHPPLTSFNRGAQSIEQVRVVNALPNRPYVVESLHHWDVEAFRVSRPDFVVLSEFDWREELRLLGKTDRIALPPEYGEYERSLKARVGRAEEFLRLLDTEYERAARFVALGPRLRNLFTPAFAPHDWLYPFPTIDVYRRR